ncbi:peptidyl-prolyl cis-trans isomerase CYP37, chloroplastic isoform X1 [Iris pallida]|uniref:Peptidyl-prolyl cis-trans isomerase CYP37, chloroplastic isoform X1 n=1 Tax=Iris pallida TaxID=29817 RepID=A0AAX6GXI3_IRIPA|nr:peptidyl-prolyl cis-trans isomerase CYP37, chloroplastic isoform X1 [Iris pallida]
MMMISTCCYISSSSTTSSFPHFRTLFSFKRKEEEEEEERKKKRRTGALLHSTSILKNNSTDTLGISTTATISSPAAAAKKQQQQQQQQEDSYYPPRGALGEEGGLKPNSLVGRGIVAALLIFAQTFSSLLLPSFPPPPALAVLYSPDTKVPRTGELALRRAIPANPNMKAIQESLEDISYLLRIPQRKPFATMEADVTKALKIATQGKESILGTIPDDLKDKGSLLYTSLIDGKGGLRSLIEFIKEKDPDKVSVGLASTLDTVADLELLQAPGLSFLLPGQYLKYPRLTGRGTVEFVIEKGDGSTSFQQVEVNHKPCYNPGCP